MRWVRANRRWGGQLALFALALQFYLSFGHIHPEDIYGPANVSLAQPLSVGLPAVQVFRPQPPDRVADQDGDICAICATMYLLGASFVPEAPRLPPPLSSALVVRADPIDVVFIAPRRTAFQSRAPPAA